MKETNATKEQYNDKDFIWLNDIIETPSKNFLNTGIAYNQKEVHKNSCFLHWPFWAVSDITGYEFTLEERKALTEQAWSSEYADPAWWGYFDYWVKSVCNLYNENHASPSQELSYYRLSFPQWEKFLDKGYSLVCGYFTSKDLRSDKYDDWIINFSKWDYNKSGYWHCVRMFKENWKIKIINNYEWVSSFNIYEIEDIKALKDKWIFFRNAYAIVIKEDVKDWYQGLDIEDKKRKLKDRAVTKAKEAYLTNKYKQT